MSTNANLEHQEGIDKLKELVDSINICLFCTNLKEEKGGTCRPMSAREVDEDGNIWFLSDINSDKNLEIKEDRNVQLFFSHPGKSSYLVVNGDAEIINNGDDIEELWTPLAKTWFKEGKNDPNISVIKVSPQSAYYWDTEGNRMVNFFKMLASVVTGKTLL